MRKILTKNCQTCGIVFEKKYTVSLKKWATMKFCCQSHKRLTAESKLKASISKKESNLTVRGGNHHNWKGGVTSEHMKARGSSAYRQWKENVYAKDKKTCTECGIKCVEGNLVAHHLISFIDRPDLRYEVSNGVVLCRPCHARVHADERNLARAIKVQQILQAKITIV